MSGQGANLLRLLEPVYRPVPDAVPARPVTPPIEQQPFEALLANASEVTAAPAAEPSPTNPIPADSAPLLRHLNQHIENHSLQNWLGQLHQSSSAHHSSAAPPAAEQ